MPFQKGNKLGGRKKQRVDELSFLNTLERAILQDKAGRLRKAAERLLDLAASGDLKAMNELFDRVDGKAKQQMEVQLDANVTFNETVAKANELRNKVRVKDGSS